MRITNNILSSCVTAIIIAASQPLAVLAVPGPVGAGCYQASECASNSCVNMTCAAVLGPVGAGCYQASECASNSCVDMACAAVPVSGTVGAWCYDDNECDSNSCVDMACAALQGSPAGASGGKLQYYDQFCINGAFFNFRCSF